MRPFRTADADGAVAVEFAFVLPLLVVIFIGTVQFGLVMYRTQMLEAAAREGARVASVGGDTTDVQARVEAGAGNLGVTPVTIETRIDTASSWAAGGCQQRGHDVRVTVSVPGDELGFDIPFLGSFEPNYSAAATFRCETTT